jgi:hypothetical protein
MAMRGEVGTTEDSWTVDGGFDAARGAPRAGQLQ